MVECPYCAKQMMQERIINVDKTNTAIKERVQELKLKRHILGPMEVIPIPSKKFKEKNPNYKIVVKDCDLLYCLTCLKYHVTNHYKVDAN